MLIVFGILGFGMMLSFRQTISQAATEGARAGAVQVDTTQRVSDATAAVSDALDVVSVGGAHLTCSSTNVTCTVAQAACANDTTHQCITVTVSYPYRSAPLIKVPFVNAIMPSVLSYSATARVN